MMTTIWILVDKRGITHREAALFKAALLENANVVDVAPNDIGHSFTFARLSNDSSINFNYATIDESYLPELKIPILQGRNFSKAFPADSTHAVLVNETFVKQAGWKNPIGETVIFFIEIMKPIM
jgi:putative ABC transport system permease protein